MAFNHVNKCDCPTSCCSCGPSHDEIFLWDSTNSSLYPDVILKERNCIVIGTLTGWTYEGSNEYRRENERLV